ncbi:MAG: tetratricopeptide repeat protein [Candidatus Kapabacteria bacterium]|nr:tetratricopeptide repeat protein [Candidatus Kapabacteria bacterium]
MTLIELKQKITDAFTEQNQGNLDNSIELCNEVLNYIDLHRGESLTNDESSVSASAFNQLGNIMQVRGDHTAAINYYTKALHLAEAVNDSVQSVACLCNIGSVHGSLGNSQMSKDFLFQALEIASRINHKLYSANILYNIAGRLLEENNLDESLLYLSRALDLYNQIDYLNGVVLVHLNIGCVHLARKEYLDAVKALHESLTLAEQLNDTMLIILNLGNLGQVYQEQEFDDMDYNVAQQYLERALTLAESVQSKRDLSFIHQGMASLYKVQLKWEEAFTHLELHHQLVQEISSTEVKQLVERMGYERKAAMHEREIEIQKAETNATRTLLHRVLPVVIANRIIDKEPEIADYFPNVSILFADIRGFTTISAAMPAHSVLRFLGYVFSDFDRIIKKHGCEKIKTIGDGYMAIAGAPIPCNDHAQRITAAAFEMIESLSVPDEMRKYFDGHDPLSIRIGIHCGPVVAGVVGQDKFIYDVFSDAVNTASRMESHGEAGRIHVSEEFVHNLTTTHSEKEGLNTNVLSFGENVGEVSIIPRGEMEIKGKGLMRTFFLERVNDKG